MVCVNNWQSWMELPPWEPPGPPMSCQLRPHHWSVAIPIIKLFYVQPKLGLYYFNPTKETLDNIPVMFSYKSGLGEAISLFHLTNWIFFWKWKGRFEKFPKNHPIWQVKFSLCIIMAILPRVTSREGIFSRNSQDSATSRFSHPLLFFTRWYQA